MGKGDSETARLLTLVRDTPDIWRDNRLRQGMARVAAHYVPQYALMTPTDQQNTCEQLIRKWNNIHRTYLLTINNNYIKGTNKIYKWADQLSFLHTTPKFVTALSRLNFPWRQQYTERATNQPMIRESQCQQPQLQSTDQSIGFDPFLNQYPVNVSPNELHHNKKRDHHQLQTPSVLMSPEMSQPIGWMEPQTIIREQPMDAGVLDQNHLMHFFESILPVIKQFNIDNQLHFKSEVLKLVYNLRSESVMPYNLPKPPIEESKQWFKSPEPTTGENKKWFQNPQMPEPNEPLLDHNQDCDFPYSPLSIPNLVIDIEE